ncbi:MAG: ABC transporter ATP-binding protein, partial [Treponema sp.]|nr:ABC transporter ATP-binding protein [Treponema sp.]
KLRVTMRAEISDLHHRLQATMIYVTHDQIEAMTMGTKIVVMSEKRIQQIGAPLYLYNHPINKFVAGFIGTPPMNFMTVKIVEKGGKIIAEEGTFSVTPTEEQQKALKEYVGKEVTFGIRPEDLNYSATPSSENNMQLKVVNKEPLGANTHVFLQTKDCVIIARAAPEIEFQLGDVVNFAPDMETAKFFSKEAGEPNICEKIEKTW